MFDTTVSGVHGSPVAARGAAEGALAEALRRWWLAQRPGWVHEGWYGADVDPEVRALMLLPPGPALAAALHRLSERRGRPCPQPHPGEAAPGEPAPGHTPGDPCLCQIVVCTAGGTARPRRRRG